MMRWYLNFILIPKRHANFPLLRLDEICMTREKNNKIVSSARFSSWYKNTNFALMYSSQTCLTPMRPQSKPPNYFIIQCYNHQNPITIQPMKSIEFNKKTKSFKTANIEVSEFFPVLINPSLYNFMSKLDGVDNKIVFRILGFQTTTCSANDN